MHRFLAAVALVSLAHAANADETLDKLTAFLEQHGVFEQVVTKDTGEKTTNTYRQSIVVDEGKLLIEIETRTTRPSVGAFGTYFPNHKIQTWETHPCEIFGYEDKGKIRFRGNSYSIESHLFRLSFFAARQGLIDLDKSVEGAATVARRYSGSRSLEGHGGVRVRLGRRLRGPRLLE